MMRDLTLIIPYYINPAIFKEQQRVWSEYPEHIRNNLDVIVVDDGSPVSPASSVVTETGVRSFRLYRALVDVRWNWIFCRNLAASETTTEWMLMTDMDHLIPAATLERLMTEKLNPDKAYRFSRVDAPNLTPYKHHPNTWCMTKKLFDRIGGYDERFSGLYGTDGEFAKRVERFGKIVMLPDIIIRVPREVIPDASTTRYVRKDPVDKAAVRRITAERSDLNAWSTKRLTFPWERVI
jgi:hypothetical protein